MRPNNLILNTTHEELAEIKFIDSDTLVGMLDGLVFTMHEVSSGQYQLRQANGMYVHAVDAVERIQRELVDIRIKEYQS